MASQNASPRDPAPNLRESESIICGWHAAMARFRRHPESIIRAYVSEERLAEAGLCLRYLAANKRSYHIVESSVLQKVSGTVHHGGLVLLVKQAQPLGVGSFLQALSERVARRPNQVLSLLVLDGLDNAQNLGAIARVGAHFGVEGILFGVDENGPRLDSAAFYRAAAGGAEADMVLSRCSRNELTVALAELEKKGWEAFGTTSRKAQGKRGDPIEEIDEASFSKRAVFVVGSETHGISKAVESRLKRLVTIPGTGAVESLNAACATSVILAEWARQTKIFKAHGKGTQGSLRTDA